MRQLHRGWVLKSVYQNALTFMGGIGIFPGATQDSHTAPFHPTSRPVEQGFGDLVVLDNFEKAEEAESNIVVVIEAAVDGGCDTACRLSPLPGQEVSYLGMTVIGMLRGEQTHQTEEAIA